MPTRDAVFWKQLQSKKAVSQHDKEMNIWIQHSTININRVNRVLTIHVFTMWQINIHICLVNLQNSSNSVCAYIYTVCKYQTKE